MDIIIVSIILVVTVVLLVTEWVPLDVTSMGIMTMLLVTGVLTPGEALSGFSNPAPITVGALFIVSAGLMRTGALEVLAEWVARGSGGREWRFLLLILLVVGVLSAFVNNTPMVILFIPIVMSVCCRHGLSPSRFLMPVSHVSILAGTTTLVGTSTNIIVSDLAQEMGYDPLSMFELSVAGLPIMLMGGAYLFFVAPRLLPARRAPICDTRGGERHSYLSEVRVTTTSRLVGQPPGKNLGNGYDDIEVYEVIRQDGTVRDPTEENEPFRAGELLIVRGSASDLVHSWEEGLIEPVHAGGGGRSRASMVREDSILEVVIPPGSRHVGKRIEETLGILDLPLQVLGIKRRGRHFEPGNMRPMTLSVGDIVLARCPSADHERLRDDGNLIVVDDVLTSVTNRRRALVAVLVFLAMIVAVSVGITDMLVASLSASFLMVLTGCVRPRVAYRSVDVKVLLLIIGTMALGVAMQKSGASDLYARGLLSAFRDAGPHVVLGGFIALTSLMSNFVSNNSTAVLLLPIAVSTAHTMDANPRSFIVGICFGASAAFATPIGYQTNLLVYGPGGYRFSDFVKLGVPLCILVVVAATFLVPVFWPL